MFVLFELEHTDTSMLNTSSVLDWESASAAHGENFLEIVRQVVPLWAKGRLVAADGAQTQAVQ